MTDQVATLTISREDRGSDRLFEQLARALASSPPDSGGVIDQRVGSPLARLTVRPRDLVKSLESQLTRSLVAAPGSYRLVAQPPRGWTARYGVLLVSPPPDREPRRPTVWRDSGFVLPTPMTLTDAWVDTRTHWVPRSGGGLWSTRTYRRVFPEVDPIPPWVNLVGPLLAQHWSALLDRPCISRDTPGGKAGRAWDRLSSDAVPKEAWVAVSVHQAVAGVDTPRPPVSVRATYPDSGHLAVFGTSGAGKTSFLAELGVEAIRRGESVVALDLHGDLAPGIVARLPASSRDRVLAIDVTDRPVPGINVLGGSSSLDGGRSVAHMVAALKRLSPDGEGIYWGFRMERIFESFLRLVQEEGGSLVDVASALESTDRREALRATTRQPELARFLETLEPILKRQPDFLWPAAARLSKLAMVPALQELLAPTEPQLAWEEGLRSGRSLLVRLPFTEIGSETAQLASTLLLTRIYLAHASGFGRGAHRRPLLLLLDEAHTFSPRLLSEILTEGRKFGVRAVVSTQYPERLASEVEHAVRGATSAQVCFRIPASNARPTAEWLGIDRVLGAEQLTGLPTGSAVLVGRRTEPLTIPPPPRSADAGGWQAVVARTRTEWGGECSSRDSEEFPGVDATEEALLLATLASQEQGSNVSEGAIVQMAVSSMTGWGDPPQLALRWSELVRRHWVLPSASGWRLGSAGAEALGIGRVTGAARESSEHRALLLEAFRIFARKGYRLEILRQGRFDTTLPDGRLELLGRGKERSTPGELARRIERARSGWAWRFFHGRDVSVEAEVSGALRAERVRHGCRKAARQGAFVLFLVGDPGRARRVRSVLQDLAIGPDRAQVWTLVAAARARPTRDGTS